MPDEYESDGSADHEDVEILTNCNDFHHDAEEEAARLNAFQDSIIRKTEADRQHRDISRPRERIVTSRKIIDQAREYQQELFERAKDENIIAVLDTGMGKTLIAAMLIRHILEKDIQSYTNDKRPKHIFFLANSVPLVHQQATFLKGNLPTPVQVITGKDNLDKWNRKEWVNLLSTAGVIVSTPAVLEQALFHNYVQMDSISLIVFDEAHHCKKNHHYSRIIRDYFLKVGADRQRPRLFGMTASPVDSNKSVADTITELEELLHSKIVTVPDASLIDFAYKPVDECWEYRHLGPNTRTPLWEMLSPLAKFMPFVDSDMQVALKMSSRLGTWFTDRILRHVFGSPENVRTLYGKFERSDRYGQMTESEREAFREMLFAAPAIVRQHSILALWPELPHMSSKVKMLYDKFNDLFATNHSARAMVFVEQRWTAVVLCDAFKTLGIPHLHAGFLTGGGSSGSEVVSVLKQEETMRKFNAGVINILFTTSVGEEGIDIPQCNIVVRFDRNHKVIQYIQSRGRARMKDSIYAHMIEEHNFQEKSDVQYFIESAQYLKDYCQQLPPDRLLGKGTKLAQLLAKESSYKSFNTDSGACCNFSNCLVILSRYASSLCHIGATGTEVYEEVIRESDADNMFQYTVRLPVIGDSTVKGARGEPRPNKILAKRSAAFECVVRLRAAKLLDENLDSKFKRPRRVEHRMAVSEKKYPYEMISKPQVWANTIGVIPNELFAVTLDFKPASPLAPMVLLTRVRMPDLPSFPVFLDDDIHTEVLLRNAGTFVVSAHELEQLTSYTLNAIFEDVFNKTYEVDSKQVAYWLVPRRSSSRKIEALDDMVDFNQLQDSRHDRTKWAPGSDPAAWCRRFLVDPLSGKHHYMTEDIVKGISIHDPEPAEFLPKQSKKRFQTSIINFTDSHWKLSQKENLAKIRDSDQPVLQAELQSLRRNYLDKPTEAEKARHMCWIAPEPLQLGRLSLAAARTALAWPSILHRLESYLIVLEGLSTIGLEGLSAELALEAHTKDSNIDDQEARTHATKSRGMGKNYERLEFIGDSLLKMTSTISVYNRTTGKEGDMHDRRKYVLCNDTLCNVSTQKTHMYRYIRSAGFDRVTWYPENMILKRGRGATGKPVKHDAKTHDLGKKTIADVSEATIGAAVMTSSHLPVETRFDLGIKAITTLTDSDDHRLASWSDFAKQHTFQDWQLRLDDPLANQLATTIETKIGYKFKFPRLARAAFTHPSEMNAPVPDYQRLEFLGDACFDWVAIWWLFSSNLSRNPEWLTEHKMAMVSNQFLGALAVLLGFDTLLFITNVKMKAAISDYARECRLARELEPDRPDFWRRLGRSPPKALADIVEATLGAMLVDSNFAYRPIEAFFDTHVKPFFENIDLYDGYANKHPTSLIYKTINGEYGCRQFRMEIRNTRGERVDADADDGEDEALPEGTEVVATVFVHRTPLEFSHGVSARYAKVKACKKALRVLEGMGRAEFRDRFACFCGQVAEGGAEEAEGEAEQEEAVEG